MYMIADLDEKSHMIIYPGAQVTLKWHRQGSHKLN